MLLRQAVALVIAVIVILMIREYQARRAERMLLLLRKDPCVD